MRREVGTKARLSRPCHVGEGRRPGHVHRHTINNGNRAIAAQRAKEGHGVGHERTVGSWSSITVLLDDDVEQQIGTPSGRARQEVDVEAGRRDDQSTFFAALKSRSEMGSETFAHPKALRRYRFRQPLFATELLGDINETSDRPERQRPRQSRWR